MAYLRQDDQDQNNKLYSQGDSSVAGQTGATQTPGQTGPAASKAGTANSWYNIQDFLGANKDAAAGYQQNLKSLGQGEIGKDSEKAQTAIGQMANIARPQASLYSNDAAWSTSTPEQVSSALQQNYQAPDYSQFAVKQSDAIANLQPGSRESILNFNKALLPSRSNYTSGMQKMDDLILGSDPNFVNSFAPDIQSQYAAQVSDPLKAATDQSKTADTATQQAVDSARNDWWSGVRGLMGEKQTGVNSALTQQQDTYNKVAAQSPRDLVYKAANPELLALEKQFGLDLGDAGGLNEYLGPTSNAYAKFSGSAPSSQTAAYTALGQPGVERYNMLGALLGQLGGDAYSPLAAQEYVAPSWSVNGKTAAKDYGRGIAQSQIPGLAQNITSNADAMRGKQGELDQVLAQIKSLMNVAEPGVATAAETTPEYQEASKRLAGLRSDMAGLQSEKDKYLKQQSSIKRFLEGK